MEFVARFEKIDGHLFRFDTRVYLESYTPDTRSQCVGAIIGKNPGSAKPRNVGRLEPLDLDGDKMLPFVGNRFRAAYEGLRKPVPENGFVRVWNLFYVCNASLAQAIRTYSALSTHPFCPTENERPPLVWFGWGGNYFALNPFKNRFLQREHTQPFFFNNRTKNVQATVPLVQEAARHTQGMSKVPIELHLSGLL